MLVVDDPGDRKDGTATAPVHRPGAGLGGKLDNGIVAVTSLWADERCSWPLPAVPSTPVSRLAGGVRTPEFGTKPQLAVELVKAAQQAGVRFRAVVADGCDGDHPGCPDALVAAKVRFGLALKPPRAPGRQPSRPHPDRGGHRARLARSQQARPGAAHPAALW